MEERAWYSSYDKEVPPQLDFEPMTLVDYLERSAEVWPDTTAVIFLNARLTFAELHEEVQRLATAMAGMGVTKGTKVAIQMPNIPQTVIAFYAALTLGATVVLTNPLYMPYEIEHQWNDAGCEVAVVMDFIYDQKLEGITDKLPVREYLVASIPEYLRFPMRQLAPLALKRKKKIASVPDAENVHAFRQLIRDTKPDGDLTGDVQIDDLAVLQYTGGTTGVSKGAMLTHANLSWNLQQIDAWWNLLEDGKEVMLASLPLFHVFGMNAVMNWCVSAGATMVLMPDPRDTEAIVKAIERHKVTLFPGAPAMFNAVNNMSGIKKRDLSSIKACLSGSAPLPADVMERFEELTGCKIYEGFGMSETSPVTHITPEEGVRKIGTVGLPVSNTDAKIVDIDDPAKEMPIGTEGELLLRGPQVMQGYWQRPDETAKTIRDGWLHTGDLAVMDEDGFFRIVGRTKDMINAGGYKVFPDEIDTLLMAHPDILECATIGVPDATRGETVKTFAVLIEGRELSADDIVAYCREHLAAYKVPRQVEFIDELPKSAVLKVLRRELRDREEGRREEIETGKLEADGLDEAALAESTGDPTGTDGN